MNRVWGCHQCRYAEIPTQAEADHGWQRDRGERHDLQITTTLSPEQDGDDPGVLMGQRRTTVATVAPPLSAVNRSDRLQDADDHQEPSSTASKLVLRPQDRRRASTATLGSSVGPEGAARSPDGLCRASGHRKMTAGSASDLAVADLGGRGRGRAPWHSDLRCPREGPSPGSPTARWLRKEGDGAKSSVHAQRPATGMRDPAGEDGMGEMKASSPAVCRPAICPTARLASCGRQPRCRAGGFISIVRRSERAWRVMTTSSPGRAHVGGAGWTASTRRAESVALYFAQAGLWLLFQQFQSRRPRSERRSASVPLLYEVRAPAAAQFDRRGHSGFGLAGAVPPGEMTAASNSIAIARAGTAVILAAITGRWTRGRCGWLWRTALT